MIKDDTYFYRQLAGEIEQNQAKGVLPFGLSPYLSLFVMETYDYFSHRNSEFASVAKRKHESIIRASRTRTKLFDDNRKDILLLIEHLKWILEFYHAWMNSDYVGVLGWLKKWLQDDLGIYFYDGHIISTTQIAMFNLGFEDGDLTTTKMGKPIGLSELSKSIGYDLGEYVGFLLSGFNNADLSEEKVELCKYNLNDKAFYSKDKKAQAYLQRIFNGKATPHINSCLLLFLATVNFPLYIFSQLVVDTPPTWFKIKFLTLYHLASSVKKLQDYYRPSGQFSELSKMYLQKLLDDSELKTIKSKAHFRNILVHYDIRNIPEKNLQSGIKYFGMIEYFFDGASFEDLNGMVDRQLLRISRTLEDWFHQIGCEQ